MRRTNEHGVHEERVIWPRANDANLDAMFRIPACEAVETIKPLARVEIVKRALAIDLERALVARNIHRSPPDVVFRSGMLDYALVLWRTPRLNSGVGDERAVLRDARVFLVTNRVLVERARRKVAVNLRNSEAVLIKSKRGRIRHSHLSSSCRSTQFDWKDCIIQSDQSPKGYDCTGIDEGYRKTSDKTV